MDAVANFFSGLYGSELNAIIQGAIVLLLLIYVDVGTAIAVAIKRKTFDWNAILDFLFTMILPYLLGYGVIQTALYGATQLGVDSAGVLAPFQAVSMALYAAMVGMLVKSIIGNFRQVDPDLPLPEDA